MRKKMIVPTVAVAGLLLAGCGSDSGTSEESPPDDASQSAPDEGQDDGEQGAGGDDADPGASAGGGEDGEDGGNGGEAGGGAQAADEAFGARADEVAASWPEPAPPADPHEQLAALTGMFPAEPSNDELTVQVGHGQCDADFGAWVAETEELVIVGGWTEPDPSVDVCAEILVVDEAQVELAAELGDRTVVDAVSGEEVPVTEAG